MNYSILLVDDERLFADSLAELLRKKYSDVDCCYSFQKANELLKLKEYDVCILDIFLPDGNGLNLVEIAKRQNFPPEIILITANDFSFNESFKSIKDSVFDFILKPLDLNYALKRIENAIEKRNKKIRDYYELKKISNNVQIIGVSEAIQRIKKMASFLANVDSHVLITGETGTGKELVAKCIHYSGYRANNPFVPVNCSAISSELFESEFFGYEKGAFTGALTSHKGLFEVAGEGTLFLDEIGEMDLNFQTKLLRVLENKEFRRVGGSKILKTKARIIAATNRDLLHEVKKGNFRKDLFYRLSVININIPPLRKRKEDIVPIAEYLWDKICDRLKVNVPKPDKKWFLKLTKYDWPGNVRELSNFLERHIVLNSFPEGDNKSFPFGDESNFSLPSEKLLTLEELTGKYILYVYEKCNYNKTQTAKILGISLSTLKRKLKSL